MVDQHSGIYQETNGTGALMSHRCLPPTLSKMNAITVQNKCRHRTALFDHKQRKGQYSTIVDHMPPAHAAMDSPWSPERFTSWARRIGPQTGLAIERVMAGRTIVERSFVPCRNILGLSKTYTPELLERACGRFERTRRPAELHRGPERDPRDQGRRQSRRPHARHTTTRRRAAGGQGEERRPPARRRRLPEGRSSMLTEEHFAMLTSFRIRAMADKLREMIDDPSYDSLTFEERMEMLIDAEASARRDRKISKLVRQARFKLPSACVEDVLYLPGRKLDKDRVTRYAECRWVDDCEVMVVISKTGCGKSYLCQALGNAACRKLIPVRHTRLADICDDLNRSRAAADDSYYRKMDEYKTVRLLIIDDFMTTPIETRNAIDLFEIMEAREHRRATLIASQLEPNEWYLRIEGELMADSILNRIATGGPLHRPRRTQHA